MIRIVQSEDVQAVSELVDRRPGRDPRVAKAAARIVDRVRRDRDEALHSFARRFDGVSPPLEVSGADIDSAVRAVPRPVRDAIRQAARHIRAVARRQIPRGWSVRPAPGVRIEQRVVSLDRVGCYVPAGRHPLPSSLLMTAIPARVAGVREVIAVCPRPDATVLCAAREAGVTRLFRVGGAHAVAALAYGTETIPAVDKIVGPGNAYVAAAKALVAADCAIDFFAGPSEIAVLSQTGRPEWIAADLIAQAEHDPDARAIFITPSRRLAQAVARAVERQLPPEGPAPVSLARHGGSIVTGSLEEALALMQRLAPEHAVCDSDAIARRLTRAGTVFVGDHSAQALGDYVTGSNHVLPTSGAAAGRGGLSAADFVRVSTVQRITRSGLAVIAPAGIALANAEGLTAHAESMAIRTRPAAPKSRAKRRPAA
jgi:histidinol dehydrogenase